MDFLHDLVLALGERAETVRGREAELEALLAPAAHRGPGVAAALVERLPADGDVIEGLSRLRVADVALAVTALAGDDPALRAVAAMLAEETAAAGRGVRADDSLTDEVKQRLREHFLVGDDAALRSYSGRGDLRGYLRISATREHLRLMKRDKREIGMDGDDLGALAPAIDPALEQLKNSYRAPFAECFVEALGQLTPRERTLLRHQTIDHLSIDQIGALYGTHRSTAARWLERARQKLAETTEELLAGKLSLDSVEVASVIRMVRSQLDVSIERLLGDKKRKS